MLFSVVHINDKDILIGISPTLSKALDEKNVAKTHIVMKEQRYLSTDAAKRLDVWLRPKEEKTIHLDLLVTHVWGDTGTGDTLYTRRNIINKALSDFPDKTLWHYEYNKASESISIKRTKLGQREAEAP